MQREPLKGGAHGGEVIHKISLLQVVLQRFIDGKQFEMLLTIIEKVFRKFINIGVYGVNNVRRVGRERFPN